MRSWVRILALISLGWMSSACSTTTSLVEPQHGEPHRMNPARAVEYQEMIDLNLYPHNRAWIKHCDQVVRANNTILDGTQ